MKKRSPLLSSLLLIGSCALHRRRCCLDPWQRSHEASQYGEGAAEASRCEPQKQAGAVEEGATAVHIVYVEQPPEGEAAEDYHVRALTSVIGSEDAAKETLVYSYSHMASGFSVKLTLKQVQEMSNSVFQVVPNRTVHLHSPTGDGDSIGFDSIHHFGGV